MLRLFLKYIIFTRRQKRIRNKFHTFYRLDESVANCEEIYQKKLDIKENLPNRVYEEQDKYTFMIVSRIHK